METVDKLKILSEDSRYDLACACGTSDEERRKRGTNGKWLYPVPLPRGGSSLLLKTLLSNACVNDCKYCPLRAETNVPRCTLQPEEVARIFMGYHRHARTFGLFLSSAVMKSADYTMDRINAVAHLLRKQYRFRGYIHLKIIPGSSDAAIEEALSLASAVSLNIETPGRKHCTELSGTKNYYADIIHPLRLMGKLTDRGMPYSRVKCTSQFIVGASDETDGEIIRSMSDLYGTMNCKRVYFSAYQRGNGCPDIPGEMNSVSSPEEPFIREHRLYQVDFLLRAYGFSGADIPLDQGGNLYKDREPKEIWADLHPEHYPVRLNSSDRETLLLVPGIGPDTAKRIVQMRKDRRITRIEDLGVTGKRLQKIRDYVILE